MLDSLRLYLWPFVAALVSGTALSLIGTQVSARREGALVLVVNQITICIYLFVMLFFSLVDFRYASWIINSSATMLAVFTGVLSLKQFGRMIGHRSDQIFSAHIVIFMGLLSLSHILASANSNFEGQVLRSLMGDVVLLSDTSAIFLIFAGTLALVLCITCRKQAIMRSFVRAIFGTSERVIGQEMSVWSRLSEVILLCFVCLCTIEFGFLFTSTAILVPTNLMAMSERSGLRQHIVSVLALWIISCSSGFMASMAFSSFPTSPAIGVALFLLGLPFIAVARRSKRSRLTSFQAIGRT